MYAQVEASRHQQATPSRSPCPLHQSQQVSRGPLIIRGPPSSRKLLAPSCSYWHGSTGTVTHGCLLSSDPRAPSDLLLPASTGLHNHTAGLPHTHTCLGAGNCTMLTTNSPVPPTPTKLPVRAAEMSVCACRERGHAPHRHDTLRPSQKHARHCHNAGPTWTRSMP